MQVKQPHKHAALIKAWADGAEIQCSYYQGPWQDCIVAPTWNIREEYEYRIKPERVFPKSTLSNLQLAQIYVGHTVPLDAVLSKYAVMNMRRLANEAIKQYILDTEVAK